MARSGMCVIVSCFDVYRNAVLVDVIQEGEGEWLTAFNTFSSVAGLVLAIVSILISVISLWIMFNIASRQDKQLAEIQKLGRELDEKVLGILKDFDPVFDEVSKLLKEANSDSTSDVRFMVYWLWFGADRGFPDTLTLDQINANTSEVAKQIRSRIEEDRNTELIFLDPDSDALADFLRNLIKWRRERPSRIDLPKSGTKISTGSPSPDDEHQIRALIERYKKDVNLICARVNHQPHIKIHRLAEIPELAFVVNGQNSRGIYFLGETVILREGADIGGIASSNPAIVSLLGSQISACAKNAKPSSKTSGKN